MPTFTNQILAVRRPTVIAAPTHFAVAAPAVAAAPMIHRPPVTAIGAGVGDKPSTPAMQWHADLAGNIGIMGGLLFFVRPKPRNQITCPISPVTPINPATLFEDPADAAKKYFLPIFNVAEEIVDGTRRLRVTMGPDGPDWILRVFLSVEPRASVPNSGPMKYSVAVVLKFTSPTSADAKEQVLNAAQESDGSWQATCVMKTLTERDQIYAALTKSEYRTQLLVRCGFTAAVPAEIENGVQLYQEGSRTVDVPVNRDPFNFDPQQSDVFQGITNVSGRALGTIPRTVEYRGRTHRYYQDEAQKWVFSYLPDHFKVARRSTEPFSPDMTLRFSSSDGTQESIRASLEYVAAPVIDAERLKAARTALQTHLPVPLPAGTQGVDLQPLVPASIDQLKLLLAMPRAGVPGAPRTERTAVTKLNGPFRDEITDLTWQNCTEILDALCSDSGVVFSGEIVVKGGGQRPDEVVPFVARINDLYGQVLAATEAPAADGAVVVTLRNGAESPVKIASLPVHITTDGQVVEARIEDLKKGDAPAQFPVRLAPGELLSLRVVPATPVTGTPDALYELDDVEVEPDRTAVWNSILKASVPVQYSRKIQVMAVAESFAPTTDVIAIAIDFKNGGHVVMKKDVLEAEAEVLTPVSDLILTKVEEGEYGYTMIVVRPTGNTRKELVLKGDFLFPDVNA